MHISSDNLLEIAVYKVVLTQLLFTLSTKSSYISKQEEQIRKIGALIVEGTVEGMKLPFRPDVVDGAWLQMEPGTTGGSKIWLGKDYSNPVNKDFFEVNKPFEGNERYTVYAILIA